MKKFNKLICYMLMLGFIISILMGGLTSCLSDTETSLDVAAITHYRDIPDITQDEIDAIAKIKRALDDDGNQSYPYFNSGTT